MFSEALEGLIDDISQRENIFLGGDQEVLRASMERGVGL
jgi:hypothetical protein